VGMNSASMNIARLIGPGIAGVLIADFGTGPAFLLNAASFLAVLVSLFRMRPAEMFPARRTPRGPGQVREGMRYVRSRPDLLLVFLVAGLVGAFGLNFQITNALMATGAFHRGAGEYGLLGSVMAIGCLAAAFLAGRREQPRLTLLIGSALAFGGTMTVAALMPRYPLYALMLIPVGFCSITVMNTCNTAVQMSTPRQLRGRVLALYVMVFQGTTPIGAPIVGWLGSRFGARWSVLAGGIAALLAAAVAVAVLARRPEVGARFRAELREQADSALDPAPDGAAREQAEPAP
jgi:MFS family permease